MTGFPEGNAIIYCEGAFGSTNGKTAHGLVRRSRRYRILSVVDSQQAGSDAGEALDGVNRGIPICRTIAQAACRAVSTGHEPTHMVVGLAPDGGRLSDRARADIRTAIDMGLHVDCGLHDFLTDDPDLVRLARDKGVILRDVRKPPERSELHFFSSRIEQVSSLRVAVLGTDSAVGKRTTAWLLVDALHEAGYCAEMIGTGQTAWLQGSRFGIVMDALPNDFVSGELEHAVCRAWQEVSPDVMVVEGQGSLLNPAYPGGFEILAATRPQVIILQHAPARRHYDGFPAHPLHPLEHQIKAIELVSERPVVALTVNHENLTEDEARAACAAITRKTKLMAVDVLLDGADPLVDVLEPRLQGRWATS